MSKQFSRHFFRKNAWQRQGDNAQFRSEAHALQFNRHEDAAFAVANELITKDRIFHFMIREQVLDQVGLDLVLGRFVDLKGRSRPLRLHIQHKPWVRLANEFSKLNPCIPVWVHNQEMSVLDGKIHLLQLTVMILRKTESNYLDYFDCKLSELEGKTQENRLISAAR